MRAALVRGRIAEWIIGIKCERNPHGRWRILKRKRESRGHYANHCKKTSVQSNGTTDDIWRTSKVRLPSFMTQHHYVRLRLLVVPIEVSTERWIYAKDSK